MNEPVQGTCEYRAPSGQACVQPAEREGLCFWHDPNAAKDGPDVKARLERLAAEGASLEGFILREARLHDVNLALGGSGGGVNMAYADLSRADLSEGHLFNIDLRGARLLKTDLRQANLNRARLEDADLLGAELEEARLEGVNWGRHIAQEVAAREAHRAGRDEMAMNLYLEAEETYRALTNLMEAKGHYTQAGHFYHKEKIMRRMQMRLWSRAWMWSKTVDLLCGYGEEVYRVIGFSLTVILACALIYGLLGIMGPHGRVALDPGVGLPANLRSFGLCVYYSVVTFTTLGYGDFVPVGWSRAVAAVEAFSGAFSMSLFVVVFVRKMTR